MNNVGKSRIAAFMLAVTGTAAAFGVASCCALPLILYGLGVSSAGLVGIAVWATPYRTPLMIAAAACLAAGAIILWRQRRMAGTTARGEVCSRPAAPNVTAVGLVIGTVLLVLGYLYV